MTPKLLRISPELPVPDVPTATEHYQSKLGFQETMRMPEGDYAIVERDEIAIHLYESAAPQRASIHIFTTALNELHRELQTRGASITQDIRTKPWGARDFRVLDLAGNEIKFTEDC